MEYFQDNLPLEGIKVLETAQGVSGPYAGKLLASLGAQVVKVELPEGDWSRHIHLFLLKQTAKKAVHSTYTTILVRKALS